MVIEYLVLKTKPTLKFDEEMADYQSKQFVVVRIRSGDRVLKDWFGGSVDQELPLVELFADFASGNLLFLLILNNIF